MAEVAPVDEIPSPTEDGANTTSKELPTTPVSRQESTTSLPGSSAKEKQVHRRTLSSEKLAKFKPSFKKGDAPISKELSERARSAPLVKKFALPSTETLINDYSAALLKHILIHGRMYLSQNYICFESKIFGIKTMEVIPFKDVTHMSKTSKKLKFAHGVQVTTSSQTYYFASFVSREKAFGMLTKIWREHVPKTDSHDDDEEDDDDDATGDYESDDSSLRKRDKKTSKEHSDLKLGRSIESQPDRSDERDKGMRRFSSPLLNRVLPTSTQGSPKHGAMSNLSASATNLEMLTDVNNPNASPPIAAPNLPSVSAPTTPVPSPPESEEEDEGMYDEGDGFLGREAQYQQILSVNFPVNVKTFFKIFFSDDSTFTQSYHITRGDKDLVVKPWSNSPQFGLIRDVLYLSPVKVPLGPSHTRITETQRYHLTKTRLVIDTIAMMLDIPYGDSFRVEGKWEITHAGPDSCKLVINIGVHFMKKTWFKGKIETQTLKETKESFQQWAALAPAEITKYNLAHPSRPSTPATSSTSNLLTTSQTSTSSSSPSSSLAQLPSPPPARVSSSSTITQTTSTESITTSTVSYAPPPNLGGRKSVDGGKAGLVNKILSNVPNPVQGFSLVHVLLVLIFGLVFIHMYLRITYLEGRIETLETILQPLVTKALSRDN